MRKNGRNKKREVKSGRGKQMEQREQRLHRYWSAHHAGKEKNRER